MPKRIALVGHCGPDSSCLRLAISKVAKDVLAVSANDDAALAKVIAEGVDLLLLNRKLDFGFSTDKGIELVRRLRKLHPGLKMMLVGNYADAQSAAVEAGALPGFGKRELGSPKIGEVLSRALSDGRG